MSEETLQKFLIEANKAGYAGGKEREWIKESNGSTTIPFQKRKWRSHDNFFGGEPYGGRTVVFYKEKPVWIMVYYGSVIEGIDSRFLYGILRNALMRMPEEYPFRGPKEYKEGECTYTNTWEGECGKFSGEEKIIQNGKLIYQANYLGGFVDQKRGV